MNLLRFVTSMNAEANKSMTHGSWRYRVLIEGGGSFVGLEYNGTRVGSLKISEDDLVIQSIVLLPMATIETMRHLRKVMPDLEIK